MIERTFRRQALWRRWSLRHFDILRLGRANFYAFLLT